MVDNAKQTTVVHFIADGEVREFHFNFQIFEAGDVDVYLDETLTDTGYNVSIDEEIGGKVIFSQPPVNGTRITIIRNLDIKRTSDFQEGGAFRAKVINHELDYQVATLQQLDEKIGRSMIYPPYVQDGVSMQLPLPSAGKALVWNQQATALINSSINVDNTIAEVTALQQQTAKSAEQVAEHWQDVLQQSAETVKNAQKAQEAAEKALTYVELSSFGNIGDIKYTTRTDVPNGGAWCDGTEYTQAMFPDVYQMLVDGKISSTDYSTFDESVSANGSCGLFALDSEAQKFKVPLLKEVYIKAGQAPLMFGAESLPNITTAGVSPFWSKPTLVAQKKYGAVLTSGGVGYGVGGGDAHKPIYDMEFNASFVSSTYKDGAKVNPDHVVYRAYVVLYSSAAEASEVQAAEFMTALASKANADMSNVDSEWVSSASKPSDKVVVLTVQASSTRYTAPANGWVSVVQDNNAVGHANLYLVKGGLGMMIRIDANGSGKAYLPIKKGEQFVYDYVGRNPSGMNNSFIFTYDKGAK